MKQPMQMEEGLQMLFWGFEKWLNTVGEVISFAPQQ